MLNSLNMISNTKRTNILYVLRRHLYTTRYTLSRNQNLDWRGQGPKAARGRERWQVSDMDRRFQVWEFFVHVSLARIVIHTLGNHSCLHIHILTLVTSHLILTFVQNLSLGNHSCLHIHILTQRWWMSLTTATLLFPHLLT
jgi:hypothetical protein